MFITEANNNGRDYLKLVENFRAAWTTNPKKKVVLNMVRKGSLNTSTRLGSITH